MENEEQLEELNRKIQQCEATIDKHKDTLAQSYSYKQFIDGLTDPEFLKRVAQEKKL